MTCKYNEWNWYSGEPPDEMRVSDWEKAKLYHKTAYNGQIEDLKAQAQRKMRSWPHCPAGGQPYLVPYPTNEEMLCIVLWCDCS